MSAAIIFFGMQQAWRMTGAAASAITGPYRVGDRAAANALSDSICARCGTELPAVGAGLPGVRDAVATGQELKALAADAEFGGTGWPRRRRA